MKSILYAFLACMAAVLGVACSDSSTIGNSLADESITIVVDSNFTVSGKSVPNPVVQSRTLSQLIGSVQASGFGSINSDFVGQFMPSLALDTVSVKAEQIDSVKLFMQTVRGEFVGDSLVPMGLEVYKLTRDLPYPIYSDFDPEGYYNPDEKFASAVYTASTLNEPDSVKKLTSLYLAMTLPVDFARDIFHAYEANPAVFSDPAAFSSKVFKGVYIRSSYGSGRITDFTTTSIRFYYHKSVYNTDSARYETKNYYGDYMAITPEVVVNNTIRYDKAQSLVDMADAGDAVLAAPAGYEVEMRFPAPEVLASYARYADRIRVLNTLTLTIPVEDIENDYSIAPPPYILMVLKNKKDEFFAENSLTDNVTSFYAPYNVTTRSYTFSGMRAYMLDLLSKENLSPDDYTFVISPVQVNMEASANSGYGSQAMVVSSIVPYVSKPAMAKILLDKAKITLTFSAGNKNNL